MAQVLPSPLTGIERNHRRLTGGAENGNPVRKITMGKLSIITAAVIASCVAGCGDRAATTADTTTPPAAAEAATPAPVDPDARRFACQPDPPVAVLDGPAPAKKGRTPG